MDGLILWKRNVDKRFEGVDDCMICFSVIHGSNYSLPKLSCKTCKKKFHSACLYKWFSTSNNATCPLCRNLFWSKFRCSYKASTSQRSYSRISTRVKWAVSHLYKLVWSICFDWAVLFQKWNSLQRSGPELCRKNHPFWSEMKRGKLYNCMFRRSNRHM